MTDSVALTVTGTVRDFGDPERALDRLRGRGSLSATAATGGITQTGRGDVEPDGFDLGAGGRRGSREFADGRGDVVDKWDSRDGGRDGQASR